MAEKLKLPRLSNAWPNLPRFRSFFMLTAFLWVFSCLWLAIFIPPVAPLRMGPFHRLLHDQDLPVLWIVGGMIVAGLVLLRWWREEHVQRLLEFISRNIIGICIACFFFYAFLAYFVYFRHPLAMDEYCPVFQSQAFAAGKLFIQISPDLLKFVVADWYPQEGFVTVNYQQGQIMSSYWPGTALLMTPFSWLGLTWLFNPTITALSIFFLHRLAKQWSGSSQTAAWAVLLTVVSPVISINAASFYSMPAHMLANIFFCLLLLKNTRRAAFGAGVVGGFALILHNPIPHMGFALPWLIYLVIKQRNLLLPIIAGYCVFGVTLGIGWVLCLGALTASDVVTHIPEKNGIMASIPKAFAMPHIYILFQRLAGLVKLLLWASLGLVPLCLIIMRQRYAISKINLLKLSFVFTFLVYFMTPFDQGHGWGFRYLHSAWFALPLIAAAYLTGFSEAKQPAAFDLTCMKRYLSLCALLSLLVLTPAYALLTQMFLRQHLEQIPPLQSNERAILFINPLQGYFAYDLARNDAFLRNKDWRLVARKPEENARIARKYLDGGRQVSRGKWGEIWVSAAK